MIIDCSLPCGVRADARSGRNELSWPAARAGKAKLRPVADCLCAALKAQSGAGIENILGKRTRGWLHFEDISPVHCVASRIPLKDSSQLDSNGLPI